MLRSRYLVIEGCLGEMDWERQTLIVFDVDNPSLKPLMIKKVNSYHSFLSRFNPRGKQGDTLMFSCSKSNIVGAKTQLYKLDVESKKIIFL
jgi:hypothetical protein